VWKAIETEILPIIIIRIFVGYKTGKVCANLQGRQNKRGRGGYGQRVVEFLCLPFSVSLGNDLVSTSAQLTVPLPITVTEYRVKVKRKSYPCNRPWRHIEL
jgi:hypothetical protein